MQFFCYTLVEAPEPATFACEIGKPPTRAWPGGEPIEDGQALRLAAGKYPLLVRAEIGRDTGDPAPGLVKLALRPCLPPSEELRKNIAFVRDNAAVLRRVIDLAPDGPEAERAARLLDKAQAGPAKR